MTLAPLSLAYGAPVLRGGQGLVTNAIPGSAGKQVSGTLAEKWFGDEMRREFQRHGIMYGAVAIKGATFQS